MFRITTKILIIWCLALYLNCPKMSVKSVQNFRSYFANKHTDKRWFKHILLGGGNNPLVYLLKLLFFSVFSSTFSHIYLWKTEEANLAVSQLSTPLRTVTISVVNSCAKSMRMVYYTHTSDVGCQMSSSLWPAEDFLSDMHNSTNIYRPHQSVISSLKTGWPVAHEMTQV